MNPLKQAKQPGDLGSAIGEQVAQSSGVSAVTKADCAGCYNDDYNHGLGGAKECWSFKDAHLVSKVDIHIDAMPPYRNVKPTTRPNCYKAQRWVRVDASRLTSEGYLA